MSLSGSFAQGDVRRWRSPRWYPFWLMGRCQASQWRWQHRRGGRTVSSRTGFVPVQRHQCNVELAKSAATNVYRCLVYVWRDGTPPVGFHQRVPEHHIYGHSVPESCCRGRSIAGSVASYCDEPSRQPSWLAHGAPLRRPVAPCGQLTRSSRSCAACAAHLCGYLYGSRADPVPVTSPILGLVLKCGAKSV